MRPKLLRPPDLVFFSTSALTGSPVCRSLDTIRTWNRRPGEVGFDFTTAISIHSS